MAATIHHPLPPIIVPELRPSCQAAPAGASVFMLTTGVIPEVKGDIRKSSQQNPPLGSQAESNDDAPPAEPRDPDGAYFLSTTLTRDTAEYGPVECDVVIGFDVTSFRPGYPASLWGPAPHPAEPAEYELAFADAAFDGAHDDAPGPMTEAERAELRAWFDAHYDDACEAVGDYAADRAADLADYRNDMRRDEAMERGFGAEA